jgi:8-oxo-dGTP pyrophosphatase MutT (NUDIX family)
VVKECWEEAGVPNELAAAATAVGFVSYVSMSEEGLKPDVLFCYDLQLPEDFVPQPQDGEVSCKDMKWRIVCQSVASA